MRIDHVCAIGGGPDDDVVVRIADVVETLLAVLFDEPVALAMRRKIDVLVGGEHAIEDAEVLRDPLRKCLMTRRGERDRPARGAHLAQPVHDLRVVRQGRDVDAHVLGKPRLESGLAAAREPLQRLVELLRKRSQKGESALDENVGVDQRTVEIHDNGLVHTIRVG